MEKRFVYKTAKFKTCDNIAGSAEFNMSRLKCQSAPLHYYLPHINSVHTNERLFFMRKKWKIFINIYIYKYIFCFYCGSLFVHSKTHQ